MVSIDNLPLLAVTSLNCYEVGRLSLHIFARLVSALLYCDLVSLNRGKISSKKCVCVGGGGVGGLGSSMAAININS